jgi:hypothetical protein
MVLMSENMVYNYTQLINHQYVKKGLARIWVKQVYVHQVIK